MIVVAYGKILNIKLLSMPKYGWINIHYSKLPFFRGAAPVQRAIMSGDNKFYGTIFKIDKGMDTGPIFDIFSIGNSYETANKIIEKLSFKAILHLLNIVKNIDTLTPKKQKGVATFAPKIKKTELEIDVDKSVDENFNKIRIGGAYFFYKNKRIEIIDAEKIRNKQNDSKQFIINGKIKLLKVKPEGKNKMSVDEWVRGLKR
jgi:methionyl-tRNA formyltransferase